MVGDGRSVTPEPRPPDASGTPAEDSLQAKLERAQGRTPAELAHARAEIIRNEPTLTDAEKAEWIEEILGTADAQAVALEQMPRELKEAAPIADTLPAAVRAALGERIKNPPLHQEDLKRFRPQRFDRGALLARAREAIKKRVKGDVLRPTIERLYDVMTWAGRDGRPVQKSQRDLAALVGCCAETVRKCIRFLEDAGALDTFNVLVRGKDLPSRSLGPRDLVRAPNAYLFPPTSAAPAEIPAEPVAPALRRVNRLAAQLERWKTAFGLQARPWSLNATPQASQRPVPRPA